MFKEDNKRTAIFFAEMWLRVNEYRLIVSNKELWDFVKQLPERCPGIPISNQEIVSKDKLFHDIEKWIRKLIV
ncbi:MAG: hypothetical protein ACE5I5_08805 [Candidatus Heimdallarchaeota archaeon]